MECQEGSRKIHWKRWNLNKRCISKVSTPVQFGRSIIFGTQESSIISLDIETGRQNWAVLILNKIIPGRYFQKRGVLSKPVLFKERIYIGGNDGFLYCLNPHNGKIQWSKGVTEWIRTKPLIIKEKLFLGIEYGTDGGSLCAYSVENGSLIWEHKTGYHIESSPAFHNKNKTVICGSNDGYVYAVNSEDGSLKWKFRTRGKVKSEVMIDEHFALAYAGTTEGVLHCIDLDSGDEIWKEKRGLRILNSPVKWNTRVICLNSDGVLSSSDCSDGTLIWRRSFQQGFIGSPLVNREKIYCATAKGSLYIIDPANGKCKSMYRIGGKILAKPLKINDSLIICTNGCLLRLGGF